MNYRNFLLALVVPVLLSACAASGPKHAEVQASLPTLTPTQGRIYFYRPSGFGGAAVRPSIYLNGDAVGDSSPGGFFFVDKSPAAMDVATSTEVKNKLTFSLEAGQTRYVRTTVHMGLFVGRVEPELVDNETGAKEISETNYIGRATTKQ